MLQLDEPKEESPANEEQKDSANTPSTDNVPEQLEQAIDKAAEEPETVDE